MKKVVYILCALALTMLLLVGSCAGLFFHVKNQEEDVMAELLNEKNILKQRLGVIEDINVDLTAQDDRAPNGELMIMSLRGTKNSGTLTYGEISEDNQTIPIMELKLADGTLINMNGKLEIMGWGTEENASVFSKPNAKP